MASKPDPKKRKAKPSPEPEGREKQLTSLAYDLAEAQLREGTASATVINHFLKLATKKEALEREILEKQKVLIEAKADSINRDRDAEELARSAIDAMMKYRATEE
jgi:hypothetical protein